MARNNRPGTIQAAVAEAYRAVGGLENVSSDLGVGLSTLSYGTEINEARPGGLGVNYLDRLGRIDPAAALPIAQHFAALAGGVFMPVEAAEGTDVWKISAHFSDVLKHHAEAHSEASEDPTGYTSAEANRQIPELQKLIGASTVFLCALMRKEEGR